MFDSTLSSGKNAVLGFMMITRSLAEFKCEKKLTVSWNKCES